MCFRAVTESINQLITLCTQQAPGQKECDNALRELEVSKYISTSCFIWALQRCNIMPVAASCICLGQQISDLYLNITLTFKTKQNKKNFYALKFIIHLN